jgi:cytoskeletal protein CcmA (bactofilin family)
MLGTAKRAPEQGHISNRILTGTTLTGDIDSKGDFRVDGRIIGKINITGKLVIGDKGHVEGEIHCENAGISGVVLGKVYVKDQLQLTSTSKVEGDIFVGKLIVEQGAEFLGHCNMGAKVLELNKPEKESSNGAPKAGKTA